MIDESDFDTDMPKLETNWKEVIKLLFTLEAFLGIVIMSYRAWLSL